MSGPGFDQEPHSQSCPAVARCKVAWRMFSFHYYSDPDPGGIERCETRPGFPLSGTAYPCRLTDLPSNFDCEGCPRSLRAARERGCIDSATAQTQLLLPNIHEVSEPFLLVLIGFPHDEQMSRGFCCRTVLFLPESKMGPARRFTSQYTRLLPAMTRRRRLALAAPCCGSQLPCGSETVVSSPGM